MTRRQQSTRIYHQTPAQTAGLIVASWASSHVANAMMHFVLDCQAQAHGHVSAQAIVAISAVVVGVSSLIMGVGGVAGVVFLVVDDLRRRIKSRNVEV